MADYLRTTRTCTLKEMHPELAQAIQGYLERFPLDSTELAASLCWETVSTKEKKGLFGGKKEVVWVGILLTSRNLIWVAGKENERFAVLSMKLRDIQAEEYENSFMYKRLPDSGINVLNLPTSEGHGLAFIPLGPEPAAQHFRDALFEAIRKAQPG